MRTLLIACLLLLPGMARAAAPEDAYVAARDQAIAAVKKAASGDAGDALQKRLSAALEAQLRGLIGPVTLAGFSGPAAMSPDTLSSGDVGFGSLDGIRFANKDQSDNVVVTTEGLLRRWLTAHKAWWNDQPNPPAEPEAAFRSESFYTQGISSDAAVSIFAPLPIRKPAGAGVAVALLVAESQDLAIEPPDQIAVALVKGGRVFVAIVGAKTKPARIAACDAVWQGFKAKSDAALAKYNASGLKDQASFDASTRFQNEGAAAFHKCWGEHATADRAFPALTQQARALADLFATR